MENKMGNVASDTFDIVAENLDKFRFVALAAGSNVTLLADQVKSFKPKLVAVRNESVVGEVKEALLDADYKLKTISGEGDVKIGKINVIIPTMRHALASEGGFCTGSFFSNSGFVQDHRPTPSIVLSHIPIVGGVALASLAEVSFNCVTKIKSLMQDGLLDCMWERVSWFESVFVYFTCKKGKSTKFS